MRNPPIITRAEMDVLRYVLDNQPVTLRDIAYAMTEKRQLAKTTTQTLLERLRKKGVVLRESVNGLNRYSSAFKREDLFENIVSEFVLGTLGGSLSPLVAYLSGHANLSDKEAAELQQLLEKLEGEER